MRASVVLALTSRALKSARRVHFTRSLVTLLLVPLFGTLLVLGAVIAIGSLPSATRRIALDASAVRGTFMRPEAVRALGPLVVSAEPGPGPGAAGPSNTTALPLPLLDSLAHSLGFPGGWSTMGGSAIVLPSVADLEARCGGNKNGGGGGPGSGTSTCLAGLIFHGAGTVPAYTLRLDKRKALAARYSANNDLRLNAELLAPSLQAAADSALLHALGFANTSTSAALTASASRSIVEVPSRFHRVALIRALRDGGGSALFAVAFMTSTYVLLLDLLWDKERLMRDGLFVIGVSRAEYGLSWLLTAGPLALPGWLIAGGLASGTLPGGQGHMGDILALYILTGISCFLVCLALDALFSSADTGPFGGLVVFAASLGLGIALLVGVEGGASPSALQAACLFPPSAFALAYARLADNELAAITGAGGAAGVEPAVALGILAADIVLYALLALYASYVAPQREQGSARHPLFCLEGLWTRLRQPSRRNANSNDGIAAATAAGGLIDDSGISVRNLSMAFTVPLSGRRVQALREVDLHIPEGSITCLLGPNGAGKSTLMGVLTGILEPTGGDAALCGASVRSLAARRAGLVGVAPQFDIVFDGLTVRDTLELFAVIKGIPRGAACAAAVADTLDALALGFKADALVTTLSGGQRRRVSVGCAFLGGPRVVLLDEMSAGVDPVSRRGLLDLVLQRRAATGCTVLLSSHFIDEARDVSDRVAILVGGEIRCHGTLSELQARFGVGYRLVVRIPPGQPPAATAAAASELKMVIAAHVPAGEALPAPRVSGNEVQFMLPNSAQIAALLRKVLSMRQPPLVVEGCEVSLQTLEDVFVKVCEGLLPHPPQPLPDSNHTLDPRSSRHNVSGAALLLRQLDALARKWTLSIARDRTLLVRAIVTVGAALAAGLLLRHADPSVCARPPPEPVIQLDSVFMASTDGAAGMLLVGGGGAAAAHQALSARGSAWGVVDGNGSWMSTARFLADLEGRRDELPPALELVIPPAFSSAAAVVNSLEETIPIAALLNLAQNALLLINLSAIGGGGSGGGVMVNTTLHRFDDARDAVTLETLDVSVVAAHALLVLGFTVGAFLAGLPAMRERLSGERALLVATGTSVGMLWVVQLAGDMFVSAVLAGVATLVLWALGAGGQHLLSTEPAFVFATLFDFSFAATATTYALSQLASKPAILLLGIVAVAILHPFAVFLVTYLAIAATQGVTFAGAEIVATVYSVQTPVSALLFGLMRIGNTAQSRCNALDLSLRPLAPAMAMPLSVMAIQGVIFFSAALVADWLPVWRNRWTAAYQRWTQKVHGKAASEPAAARAAADGGEAATGGFGGGFLLQGLGKDYPGMPVPAVCNVSMLAPPGSCVALLGDNGCGKTTLFSMVSGRTPPSRGDCLVDGHSILADLPGARRALALCPQFDALPPLLSAREAIVLFGRLKGVPIDALGPAVDGLLAELGLDGHAEQQLGALSGGSRRKVSLAAALVGGAPCMLLDEATTGMDALSKRLVWRALSARRDGRTCLFVTHSLEEAEALSTQVAIMSRGRLLAHGTLAQLREQFEGGYTVELAVASGGNNDNNHAATATAATLAVRDFPGAMPFLATSGKCHDRLGRVRLQSSAPFVECFEACERLRIQGIVTDFSVSPTTLETIFTRAVSVEGTRRIEDDESVAAAILPWSQRDWERGLGGGLLGAAANVVWLTAGLGVFPLFLGALFAALASLFFLPLCPLVSRHAARRLALMVTPFSAHLEFMRARGQGRPRDCRAGLTEAVLWLCVGLPTVGAHMLCAVALAASVFGLPLAVVHLRLAALNISLRWVLPGAPEEGAKADEGGLVGSGRTS
jgi:ATP-binding cassette subfamily A (ABC1) protein 3